jgi:hypothetical protein
MWDIVFPFSWLCCSFTLSPLYSHSMDHAAQKTQHRCGPTENICLNYVYCCVTSQHMCKLRTCCIATVCAWTTGNTAPLLLAVCVMRVLPSNGSMCHNIYSKIISLDDGTEGDSEMESSSPMKVKSISVNCWPESDKPYISRDTILILFCSNAGI